MSVTIQVRRDSAANWTSTNPTLHQGEIGLETDTGKFKIGDGSSAWSSLAYFASGNVTSVFGRTGAVVATTGDYTAAQVGAVSVTGGGKETVSALGNITGATTVNLANGNVFTGTQTGNVTLTLSGATNSVACTVELRFTQDATGGRTVTFPGSVSWAGGGSAPAPNTAASAVNVWTLQTLDGGTTWLGSLIQPLPPLPLTIPNGGTGATTASTAYNALSPMTTSGDMEMESGGTAVRLPVGSNGQVLTVSGGLPSWQPAGSGSANYGGIFGDGSDGAVTLDGSTSYAGFSSLSGSTYTLTRDVYATSLTVNSGVTLKTSSYRIFCTGTVTGPGTIANAGNAASGATGGARIASGTLTGGGAGASGGTGAGAAASAAFSLSLGVGGGGYGGNGTGGSGGVQTASWSTSVTWWRFPGAVLNGILWGVQKTYSINPAGAEAGASGAGDGTNSGGGGGSGGGIVAILAHAVTLSGTINASGGAGATPATGNCGGGGGGGGGLIIVYTLSAWTPPTTNVAGGAAGSGVGSGTAGGAGGAGNVLNVVVA